MEDPKPYPLATCLNSAEDAPNVWRIFWRICAGAALALLTGWALAVVFLSQL